MKSKSKLYHLTSAEFGLPYHIDHNRNVITTSACDIPMISWPNGQWCLPANMYMLELFNRGLSRKNRGGTLLIYAVNISHLLRYCFGNTLDLFELTDNHFAFFIKTLQGERRINNPEVCVRDANAVIAIGRTCLDFLSKVGKRCQEDEFVGPNGQIRAEMKEFVISIGRRGRVGASKITRTYWHHSSFPTPDPKSKRLPISSEIVLKIREVIHSSSSSVYLRKRRYVMVKLLEITGGRRSEVVALTVESVYEASRMHEPMLKLLTAKKPGGREEFRLVPIGTHDVAYLLEFIEVNRRRIVRSTIGLEHDDGFVLVSETTGRKLRPNTITQEIRTLSLAAGILEKSCPHMFRHRFITKLFVALIEQHKLENKDDFRRALLDLESIKRKILEWTGHSSINSLDVYISLAFEEVTNFKKTYNVVSVRQTVDSLKANLTQLQDELRNGASPMEVSFQLQKLVGAFDMDLDRMQKGADTH